MILQPLKQVTISEGSVSYSKDVRAWNTIRLRKGFIEDFPMLKNRLLQTSYSMIAFHSYELLEKEIRDIVQKKLPLPVLLFLEQELPRE